MNSKILYFIDYKNKTVIYTTSNKIEISNNYYDILNNKCLRELTTLEGRKQAFQKLYNYKYNIPLYINDEELYFKIALDNNYWINYYQVINIIKKDIKTIIYFRNETRLIINKDYQGIYNKYLKLKKIIKEKNNIN